MRRPCSSLTRHSLVLLNQSKRSLLDMLLAQRASERDGSRSGSGIHPTPPSRSAAALAPLDPLQLVAEVGEMAHGGGRGHGPQAPAGHTLRRRKRPSSGRYRQCTINRCNIPFASSKARTSSRVRPRSRARRMITGRLISRAIVAITPGAVNKRHRCRRAMRIVQKNVTASIVDATQSYPRPTVNEYRSADTSMRGSSS